MKLNKWISKYKSFNYHKMYHRYFQKYYKFIKFLILKLFKRNINSSLKIAIQSQKNYNLVLKISNLRK